MDEEEDDMLAVADSFSLGYGTEGEERERRRPRAVLEKQLRNAGMYDDVLSRVVCGFSLLSIPFCSRLLLR